MATYAARWMVELLFAEWKSRYRLADMPSRKKTVVEALLYASLITLAVSRRLMHLVRRRLRDQADFINPMRWAAVSASVAHDLLRIVVRPPREVRSLERDIAKTLLHEAPDPNRSRPTLLQSVEDGVHDYTT